MLCLTGAAWAATANITVIWEEQDGGFFGWHNLNSPYVQGVDWSLGSGLTNEGTYPWKGTATYTTRYLNLQRAGSEAGDNSKATAESLNRYVEFTFEVEDLTFKPTQVSFDIFKVRPESGEDVDATAIFTELVDPAGNTYALTTAETGDVIRVDNDTDKSATRKNYNLSSMITEGSTGTYKVRVYVGTMDTGLSVAIANVNVAGQLSTIYLMSGYDAASGKMLKFDISGNNMQTSDPEEGEIVGNIGFVKGWDLYMFDYAGENPSLCVVDAERYTLLRQNYFNASSQRHRAICATYDVNRGAVFAISCEKVEGVGERYYMNVVDEATGDLKRIATIATWYDDETRPSIAPNTLMASYGTFYVTYLERQGGNVAFKVGRLDGFTYAITNIFTTDIVVDKETTVFASTYANSVYTSICTDGEHSTIYKLPTYATGTVTVMGEVDGCLTTLYQRPSTANAYGTSAAMAPVTDFKVEMDGTVATVTYTTPSTDIFGRELVLQDWAATQDYSKSMTPTLYVDNGSATVTKPQYCFVGDQVTITCDLGNGGVYGLTNPNGVHVFSLNISIGNGYSAKAPEFRPSQVVFVGAPKPAVVENPLVEKTGDNSGLFTWTAPTESEYVDFGYALEGDLTYRVVRNADGVVVADNVSGTSVEVDNMAKEPGSFDYSIYAINDGTVSDANVTNAVACQPPTYDYFAFNTATNGMDAFNLEENCSTTEWAVVAKLGDQGFVAGNKLYTFTYAWAPTYSNQIRRTWLAEKFVQQGYDGGTYWYTNQGKKMRRMVAMAFDPNTDLAYGVMVDSVKNADGIVTDLGYYVMTVDSAGNNNNLIDKIVDYVGKWNYDGDKDGVMVKAMAFFGGQGYAAVLNRKEGALSYDLCTFEPMSATLEKVAAIDLPMEAGFDRQFFFEGEGKLYLGYNNGTDPTALYEIDPATAAVTKVCDMKGIYSFAYRRPSLAQRPALSLADLPLTNVTVSDAETGAATMTFTVPVITPVDGVDMPDNQSVAVSLLVDGKPINTGTTADAGSSVTLDFTLPQGLHVVTAVCTPVADVAEQRVAAAVVVGPAKPDAVTEAAAEAFVDYEVNFTWKAPTTSLWADFGANLNGAELIYVIECNEDGNVIVDDCEDQEFYAFEAAAEEGTYTWSIYAVNGTQRSLAAVTNAVDLPFSVVVPTAIEGVAQQQQEIQSVFNAAGQQATRLQKGLNLVRTKDGRTVKVLVK